MHNDEVKDGSDSAPDSSLSQTTVIALVGAEVFRCLSSSFCNLSKKLFEISLLFFSFFSCFSTLCFPAVFVVLCCFDVIHDFSQALFVCSGLIRVKKLRLIAFDGREFVRT